MSVNERTVSVKLRLIAREYVAGGRQALGMDRQLMASQAALGEQAKKTSRDLDGLAASAERSGRRTGRGALLMVGGIAALGAAGGGLKVLPPLLAAAGTGLAALPVAATGAAAGIGVAVIATRNLSEAFGELDKASKVSPFAKLAPEARALVNTYAGLKPQLQEFQKGLQGRAFTGTSAGLTMLVTKTLPQVSGSLNKIADDWADLFAEIALSANQPEVIGMFNTITASADRFFDGVTARMRPTSAAIATLVTATDPVARAFGDELLGWIDRFNAKIMQAQQDGSLAEFFEAGAHAARELMSITESVFRITGMVIQEAARTNDATATAGQTLEQYIESGRAAEDVAGVVRTLTTAWEGLRDVLGPLGVMVRDALADPGVAATAEQLFGVLAAGATTVGALLGVLLALNDATGGVLLTVAGLALIGLKLKGAIDLATVSAARGAAALGAYGAAGARASTMMTGLIGTLGKVAGAFFALELAHQLVDGFQNSAANVDKLDASLKRLAESGEYAGELMRVFNAGWGDMGLQAEYALADDAVANFLRSAEKAVPIAGDLAEMLGAPTFSNSAKNFADLDAAIVRYAQSTGDLTGANKILTDVQGRTNLTWEQMRQLLPGAWAELENMQVKATSAGRAQQALAERTALLAAPIEEAVTAGRDLISVFEELNGGSLSFGKAELAAEKATREFQKSLKENGKSLDVHSQKGAANREALFGMVDAAAKAAQAKLDETGSIEKAAGVYDAYIGRLRTALAQQGLAPATIDAIIAKYAEMPASLEAAGQSVNTLNSRLRSIPKGTKFTFNGESVVDAYGNVIELAGGIKGLPVGKTFRWDGKSLVDGRGKVFDLKKAVQSLPASKTIDIRAVTGGAEARIQAIKDSLARLSGKTITIRARTEIPAGMSVRQLMNAQGGAYVPRQRGGATVAAAGGLLQPTIAPPGTRYQWAEPETGGELFLPRRGINVARGRALLDIAAQWYGMRMMPMRFGGFTAAASGLVNVAPREVAAPPARASRLDSAEAYLQARSAVNALNAALKENGRSFNAATKKGQENRSALFSGIRAAQDAARTKFEETGSVTAANRAYDEHIARLKRTLQQQKVNSATIRQLLALAQRPTYDTAAPAKAPSNSLGNIGFAKAQISALGGIEELRDQLSLNRVGVDTRTDFGRENLGNIITALEAAAAAAQARFEQTGNSKTAGQLYDQHIAELRKVLAAAGYSKTVIDGLLKNYGRITLTPNFRGGVYMAASGLAALDRAQIFGSTGSPLYGFAEPGTGGEAFIPRFGDRQRGRDLVDVAAGWYGGRFVAGGGGASSTTIDQSTHLTVRPVTYNPTQAELAMHQREMDARARVGRPR